MFNALGHTVAERLGLALLAIVVVAVVFGGC
jgi:hypothetical protein